MKLYIVLLNILSLSVFAADTSTETVVTPTVLQQEDSSQTVAQFDKKNVNQGTQTNQDVNQSIQTDNQEVTPAQSYKEKADKGVQANKNELSVTLDEIKKFGTSNKYGKKPQKTLADLVQEKYKNRIDVNSNASFSKAEIEKVGSSFVGKEKTRFDSEVDKVFYHKDQILKLEKNNSLSAMATAETKELQEIKDISPDLYEKIIQISLSIKGLKSESYKPMMEKVIVYIMGPKPGPNAKGAINQKALNAWNGVHSTLETFLIGFIGNNKDLTKEDLEAQKNALELIPVGGRNQVLVREYRAKLITLYYLIEIKKMEDEIKKIKVAASVLGNLKSTNEQVISLNEKVGELNEKVTDLDGRVAECCSKALLNAEQKNTTKNFEKKTNEDLNKSTNTDETSCCDSMEKDIDTIELKKEEKIPTTKPLAETGTTGENKAPNIFVNPDAPKAPKLNLPNPNPMLSKPGDKNLDTTSTT